MSFDCIFNSKYHLGLFSSLLVGHLNNKTILDTYYHLSNLILIFFKGYYKYELMKTRWKNNDLYEIF